jgi:hypothetical protein
MSETGSLDRLKSAAERRKKVGLDTDNAPTVSRHVEGTRVNPETLIDEILRNKKLDQLEESAESEFKMQIFFQNTTIALSIFLIHVSATGLQLFIASDGTASLGGQEIKARMPQGARQVVMKTPR